jgi:hypothetical protein
MHQFLSEAVKNYLGMSMATSGAQLVDGGNRVAHSDLSTKQYCAVSQTTTSRHVDLTADDLAMAGILLNTPKAGEAAIICQRGICQAQIGTGGVTAGDALEVEASTGKLVTAAGGVTVAIAIETCAAGAVGTVDVGALA